MIVNGRLSAGVGTAGGEEALMQLMNVLAEGEHHP